MAMTRSAALYWLARIGYAARGLVYLVVGGMAAAAVDDDHAPSIAAALAAVADAPLGHLAVTAIATGLFCYAGFRALEAVLDTSAAGSGAKGLARRAGMLAGAGLHAGLGAVAAALAAGIAGWGGGAAASLPQRIAGAALAWPLGQWLVAGIGIGAILMGIGEAAKARRVAFEDIAAPARAMPALRLVGRVGLAAKGAVFGLVGLFFLRAAWQAEADPAGGVRAALQTLAAAPLGNELFLAAAAGVLAYGGFSVLKGWFHRRPGL